MTGPRTSCDRLKHLPSFPSSVEEGKPLSELSTFKIGGPARFYTAVDTVPQMQEVVRYCYDHGQRFVVIGKGSNALFDDRGFDGLVIANRIAFLENPQPNQFYVGAGYSFSRLGSLTARRGWGGLEFASGIPGSVGGAVFMNAGANGRETCEALTAAYYLDTQGQLLMFPRQDIQFGYRFSSFQEMAGVLVGALFTLQPDSGARLRQMQIIDYRKRTQPYSEPSVGCIFCNPVEDCRSAGALIDQAGLKGVSLGGAQVSTQHANFIINTGWARASDVLNLMQVVKERVKQSTGVELQSEVRIIPYISEVQ